MHARLHAQAGAPPLSAGQTDRPVVAVLPFVNVSGQPADAWIGDGIAETLLSDLARGGQVSVVGPGTLLAEAGKQGTALSEGDDRVAIEIGRRLGLAWLVRGGYQHASDQVRITARVIDVQTGAVVGTAKVDGAISLIFELQDRIVTELGADLRGAQPPAPALAPVGEAPRAGSNAVVGAEGGGRPGRSAKTGGPPAERGASAPAGALSFDGPPAPVPPAVASERDARGRLTIRAVRLTAPLVFDGRLDDEVYQTVPSFGDFIQQDPAEGEPATEKTDAWVFYDDRNVYVSARLFVSQPNRIRANEMRRDSINILRNDFFGVTLDTLFDHRSGVFVMVNALGGQRDALVTDEQRSVNFDYNPIWDVRSQRFDKGWTIEIAIPFKSLRYVERREQVWGLILMRTDWWKNEFSYLTPIPRISGLQGPFRVSQAATLVGIEAPPPALNLEVKPYVTGNSLTVPAQSDVRTSFDRDVGVDVRYGLTKSLTADFTYNTEFAQAEVDDQQINLTRFNLFYPEKREFFLEGQGLFSFGGAAANGTGLTPIMFFSRQIGLNGGQVVPIQAGGRLMGKAGRYNVGVLSIRTDDVPSAAVPATRFSVMRVKRDILRRSSIGAIATQRSPSVTGASNLVFGADMSLAFLTNVEALTYYARSRTPGTGGDDESYRGRFFYNGDKYGFDVDYLKVGDAFNPEIGFLPRRDFRRTYVLGRFSPRPKIRGVRKLTWDARLDNIEGVARANLQTRTGTGTFRIDFHSGDTITAEVHRVEDRPEKAFGLPGGVIIRPGAYQYMQGLLTYQLGSQRRVTGTFAATTGAFYGGEQSAASYNGRVELTRKLGLEPRVSLTRLNLAERRVLTTLVSVRTSYSMNPRMFVSALLQYNSAANVVGLNTRFRWEYRPGSDLFLVYNEGRDTAAAGFPGLSSRQVVAKFTRLFRF